MLLIMIKHTPLIFFIGIWFALFIGTRATAQTDPGPVIITHHESIPNPVYGSGFRVAPSCQNATQPCQWDDPDTWALQTVPNADSLVIIDGYVEIRDQNAEAKSVGVYPSGQLTFAPDADTCLETADLLSLIHI